MRNLTPDAISELTKSVVRPFVLCDIEFADQTRRMWTGLGTLSVGGKSYLGIGTLGKISAISETMDVQANGVSLSLSGVPTDVIPEALSYCQHGLPVILSLGFMTDSGAVINSPVTLMAGLMDSASVDEGPDDSTIIVTVESRLADLQRARIRRFTDDDQQRTSPGDKGFEFVPTIQDWNQPWGFTAAS